MSIGIVEEEVQKIASEVKNQFRAGRIEEGHF
jgi:hypothetical protein